ncbi:transcriptional regulator [Halorientalis brevis]|uniref:Transcriptional regulator n=1 Tax=Halorientalis brevis TaxID=1126241 RepID=A0ABD6CAH3_9EURY|nr:transcriptional regulator [Halorientalis brevis]
MEQAGPQGVAQLDALFETIATRERRRLLYYLREHGSATKDELVDVLTGWAATDRAEQVTTRADWTRTKTRLHHVHLPKLQDNALVEYDPQTDVVRLTDLQPWAERCLDAALESEQALASPRGQPAKFIADDTE